MRVHDSQACRKMDVTRERTSRILELREIFLSFQTSFNLVNVAVACAIPESISGLEPSSVITEPRYLKLVTVSSFCPFTLISVLMPLISVLMPLVLFVISLVFSALISMPQAVEALSRRSTNFSNSSFLPAKPLMSALLIYPLTGGYRRHFITSRYHHFTAVCNLAFTTVYRRYCITVEYLLVNSAVWDHGPTRGTEIRHPSASRGAALVIAPSTCRYGMSR